MSRKVQLLFTLFTLLFCGVPVVADKVQQSTDGFTLHRKPIHPLSVAPLIGDLASEEPQVAAVDLEASARSGSHQAKVTIHSGTIRADDRDGGFVAYRHIGATPGGLHVFVLAVNGGGSGVLKDAVWVKLVRDQVWEDGKKRDRTMLVKVGSFPLGDEMTAKWNSTARSS